MIRQQIMLAAASFAGGMVIILLYELLFLLRVLFKTGIIIRALTDVLYWEAAAIGLFYVIYRINGGDIRGYVLFFLFLGMLFFWWAFGRGLLEISLKALKKVEVCVNMVTKKIKAIFNKR